jgi:hypothetical protein
MNWTIRKIADTVMFYQSMFNGRYGYILMHENTWKGLLKQEGQEFVYDDLSSICALRVILNNNIPYDQFKLSETKEDESLDAILELKKAKQMSETNNKFYTPSIEEFKIGFEYQLGRLSGYDGIPEEDYEKCWNKMIFDERLSINDIKQLIQEKAIRVRYLDSSDIESLGYSYYARDYFLRYFGFKNNDNIMIELHGNYKVIIKKIYSNDSTDNKTLFEGVIKNINELKVLLTQLGINN